MTWPCSLTPGSRCKTSALASYTVQFGLNICPKKTQVLKINSVSKEPGMLNRIPLEEVTHSYTWASSSVDKEEPVQMWKHGFEKQEQSLPYSKASVSPDLSPPATKYVCWTQTSRSSYGARPPHRSSRFLSIAAYERSLGYTGLTSSATVNFGGEPTNFRSKRTFKKEDGGG